MARTVIGLMDDIDGAQLAVRDLVNAGFPREDIGFLANQRHAIPGSAALNESEGGDRPSRAPAAIAAALAGAGLGAVTGSAIGGLIHLGVPAEAAPYCAEGLRRGGILVTVATDSETQAGTAAGIMQRHGAADTERQATQGAAGRQIV